ncbi:MAG TPA: DUF1572 family protein [Vicinamibacterales bacterium]|nr:DUF1572 family protein [Vicinamibacterales bacterium]
MPNDSSSDSPILSVVIEEFQKIKKLADKSIEQLTDDQLHETIDPDANSIAVLMRHMSGNMRSRWTDFLTSDGEKPDRRRDGEFEDPRQSRAELLAEWEEGWQCVFDALKPLSDGDLQRTVRIRNEPHSVYKAISRQVAHYAGHAYQILFLAKHMLGPNWKTLSIPRGQSEEFNRHMLAKLKSEM